eukprot:gene30149-35127_t
MSSRRSDLTRAGALDLTEPAVADVDLTPESHFYTSAESPGLEAPPKRKKMGLEAINQSEGDANAPAFLGGCMRATKHARKVASSWKVDLHNRCWYVSRKFQVRRLV